MHWMGQALLTACILCWEGLLIGLVGDFRALERMGLLPLRDGDEGEFAMELITLGIFCAALVAAILTGAPTVYALLVGLAAFCFYAWRQCGSGKQVALMCWHGIAPIAKILGMLAMVGVLTGLWRAAGVIPAIVYHAVPLISPGVFVLATFLLNCLVSVLTGTSFGTAATVGSICISMAGTMGVPLPVAGGAALSGAFFGDRCSPISTSALLVADLTGTDFYTNLKRMVKSAAVPFAATCAVFFGLGLLVPASGEAGDMAVSLAQVFDVSPVVLLPAIAVFALALMRVDILVVIGVGIIAAVPLCVSVQGMALSDVVLTAVVGYAAPLPQMQALSGGGLVSMFDAVQIVCITSAYAGIFEETPLLAGIDSVVQGLARRLRPYAVTLATSVFTSLISCNQTLAIMLSHQLCRDLGQDPSDHALDLEDSVVLVAGLVPWSIAGAVPLASMGAPVAASMAFAVYLYAVPAWRLSSGWISRRFSKRG